MRSVLGALGHLARESRPDLSGPVSILQRRFNKAQVSDIQETNRVVRLAKAHTDLALPICKIPLVQICLVSYGDSKWWKYRVEQAQVGYVIMFADMGLVGRNGSSCNPGYPGDPHRVKRVGTSGSAAEAMGLSEAFAEGEWVRALWSEVVLGFNLREWRGRKNVTPLISVTDSKGQLRSFTQRDSRPQ